jgi:predicted NBD/HSP70 family sugar kinase
MVTQFIFLTRPTFVPPLDIDFQPAVLANRAFRTAVKKSGYAVPIALVLERPNNTRSRFDTIVFDEGHPFAEQNNFYIERIVKFLLWQRGAFKLTIGGPSSIGKSIQAIYAPEGQRSFDYDFMGRIYRHPFSVVICDVSELPESSESEKPLGRHLDGNRIGFDLGASDLKVSAVKDGEAIFSTEIEWQPSLQTDPQYHREYIMAALQLAQSKLPSLDAIGGSSAGVYINNCPMVASIFRGIPEDEADQVHTMFLDIGKQMGVPLEIVNDGEVTALAGSMSLNDNGILGIAMGSSQAGGYVTQQGNITDWLNELAFAPIDYNPNSPIDEWSGDKGVGALYFSQQCVFRLAPRAGITIPQDISNAAKLLYVQEKLATGHEGAAQIWQSIGIYLGYAIAHYAEFYDIKHVLILGRCTSGLGGSIILGGAKKVITTEFPELAKSITLQLPDEKNRRVGQSIAAASLPLLENKP